MFPQTKSLREFCFRGSYFTQKYIFERKGRNDLKAVDNNGNIVLIKIKRDRKDIENHREAFEFKTIRYTASYATIDSPDDLVKQVYAQYIDKYMLNSNSVSLHHNLMDKISPVIKQNKSFTRRSLPKIDTMLEWELSNPEILLWQKTGKKKALF